MSNPTKQRQYRLAAILAAVILVADQVAKILVKTNMQIGEEIPLIGTWFRLHFIENEGMAFGMAFGGAAGKIVLTVVRLVASGAILWYLLHSIRRGTRTSLVACITLIFVGAVGNIIDSCFYGLLFSESYYSVAQFLPPEGGYAPLLQGRVVDMLYFPVIETTLPGGKPFVFFNAIFNIADAAITIGVFWLVIDQIFIAPKHSKPTGSEQK
ncbi:MAG: lipoprotein signal peptidase [Bacteroidales bacterium]|nr:lipoprotein signal peptidase [Bacteroidales bacterium]